MIVALQDMNKYSDNLGNVEEKDDLKNLDKIWKAHRRSKRLYFTAYKFVTNKERQSPIQPSKLTYNKGEIVEMPRKSCNNNPNMSCAKGINVASNWWVIEAAGGKHGRISSKYRIIELKIRLCDIVCIPKSGDAKFRVCRVTVMS